MPATYRINDRVYVTQLGDGGPFGNATVRGLDTDGIGNPTARIRLDEAVGAYGRRIGTDGSGQDVRDWTVGIEQLRPLEHTAVPAGKPRKANCTCACHGSEIVA